MRSHASVSFRSLPMLALPAMLAAFVTGCAGSNGRNMLAPSDLTDTAARPAGPLADSSGATTISFDGFDPATLSVMIHTTTISAVGLPYIDAGKIQLQILVDATGKPVPCGTAGATYVRFDNQGGGITPSAGQTSHAVDLDDLSSRGVGVQNAQCGDTICIRAHYITGGGPTKVDTHLSEPTPYTIVCSLGCTQSQGYWKTHGPVPTGNNQNEWPVSSLTLGTVNYTALELQSIMNAPVAGNGLISLAHQLIAAKLNIANGANGAAVAATIAAADALIGALVVPPVGTDALAPSATSALVDVLTQFNEGAIGPGHCPSGN
ncbi:MAG TPA: hypothetical protein VFO19_12660 [Vicinamibacterales bacterium]|nr:hypothetical protein [Vicinamibacterales bacterium]